MGLGGGDTSIKQVDEALHPDGSNFISLIMKSRISAKHQPDFDHIIGSAIKSRKLNVPAIPGQLNSAEAHVIAHAITQYALNGQSRNEFTRILGGFGNMISGGLNMFRGRRRRQYDQSGQVSLQ